MGEFEAVADAVTGGVLGRAVEPKAGEGDGHTHESNCLNCGTPLAGPFCNQCGQHAHVHRKLAALQDLRAAAAKAGAPTAKFDEKIGDLKGEMTVLEAVKDGKIDASTLRIQSELLGGISESLGQAAKNPELLFYKVKTNAYK